MEHAGVLLGDVAVAHPQQRQHVDQLLAGLLVIGRPHTREGTREQATKLLHNGADDARIFGAVHAVRNASAEVVRALYLLIDQTDGGVAAVPFTARATGALAGLARQIAPRDHLPCICVGIRIYP